MHLLYAPRSYKVVERPAVQHLVRHRQRGYSVRVPYQLLLQIPRFRVEDLYLPVVRAHEQVLLHRLLMPLLHLRPVNHHAQRPPLPAFYHLGLLKRRPRQIVDVNLVVYCS